jgi:hypothetical protein
VVTDASERLLLGYGAGSRFPDLAALLVASPLVRNLLLCAKHLFVCPYRGSRMSNGTSLARNSKQDLASIPMAQRGLSRLAIARLKSARVPVAPLLKRVGLTLTRTCVTRLGLLPSLKVKLSALPMKLVAPVIITKRSPPSCARIAFAKSGQSFLRFL